LKKWTKETNSGSRKKQKLDKHAYTNLMVLTEGELDEIGDKLCDTMIELWTQFEQEYMYALGSN